jgi:hypothetical protein
MVIDFCFWGGLKILKTRDAHALYEKYGFVEDDCMTKRQ